MTKISVLFFILAHFLLGSFCQAELSPAAVGWGGLFVPGLGATLRGEPKRGMLEATLEIGLFYGGTFNVKEGDVNVDGSVIVPHSNNLYQPLIGQSMQEFGIKLHMYDAFFNYQQAALAAKETERELTNPQPLYTGSLTDILSAPFRLKNLSEPLVLGAIGVGSAYLVYQYQNTAITREKFDPSEGEDRFYALNQIGIIPFGGALGEEALFRGFIQREVRGYTRSLWLSIGAETLAFTAFHTSDLQVSAVTSGLAYGWMVDHYHGNLEPTIATHFWLNVVDGVIAYWQFRRAQGKNVPLQPPFQTRIGFSF